MKVLPGEVKTSVLHQYLMGSVSPRPICFASTIDNEGNNNLAPYSFFGVFGSNPATLIFSPARRVRDNTIKHTLENVMATMEVVVNMVNYDIVQQMSLASTEYPKGVDEFVKAGFTPLESDLVAPMRVKESPVQMECKVRQIIHTGEEGGAGNLVICEVLCMHIDEAVLDDNQNIDPHKIDLVARMGGNYYCRASGDAVFEIPKPNRHIGMGIDNLPEDIRNSPILTGNDLAFLGNYAEIPDFDDSNTKKITNLEERHKAAQTFIHKGDGDNAWKTLLN